MDKKKVAFICVHNSCRSQIAEALGKHLAGDKFDFYSAGTETKSQINQDAVRLMKQLYGIDMEQSQYSKTIDKIPTPDIAISMGCDVGCPYIGRAFDDNWGLPDPTGKSDECFIQVIERITQKIKDLKLEKFVSSHLTFLFSMTSKKQKIISVISINTAIKIVGAYTPSNNTIIGIIIEKT